MTQTVGLPREVLLLNQVGVIIKYNNVEVPEEKPRNEEKINAKSGGWGTVGLVFVMENCKRRTSEDNWGGRVE